jgi:serine/threonine protein kinase
VDTIEGVGAQGGGQSLGAGLTNLTGKQLGRYLIGQQLGSGGVATVYRAYDQVQGQTVALKLLLPGADDKTYTRFRNEAMTAGALRHPHIVRILQIGIAPQGEVAYIAMELVDGESLADLLRQQGRLRPEESANLLEPIARARWRKHIVTALCIAMSSPATSCCVRPVRARQTAFSLRRLIIRWCRC